MQEITRILARYATSVSLEQIPREARHAGVRAFVNWVGCAAGGSREHDVALMVRVLDEFSGARDAVLVGRVERLDSLNAAFVNSMSSAALAFNDTHMPTVAHPTSPVAAALLAIAARRPVTGPDFLRALILGIELQCRIGNILCTPPAECQVGLSTQGLLGGIGAAVGVGAVLGLDERGMATAIGLAANQAAGLRESQSTMGSHFIPGHAARCGLLAALLAERAFTCSSTMIEGDKGFAVSYASRPQFDVALEGLGMRFEISKLSYKPYPAGVVIHPIIDACLDLVRSGPIAAEEIGRIELTVNPLAIKLTDLPEPRGRSQGLVSMQHWAVATLVHGAAGVAQVTDAVVSDPAIARLRREVRCTPDAGTLPESAVVRVFMKNGDAIECRIQQCRGSPNRPLSDEDIASKALGQLATVFRDSTARSILTDCWRVSEWPGLDAFLAAVAGPA